MEWFMLLTAGVVLLLFTWALKIARDYTVAGKPKELPPVVKYLISSVNAILVANLGAILGITISIGALSSVSATAQWGAAVWYFAALIAVIWFWSTRKFEEDPDKIASPIPEVGRTGIGVLIAILAVVLGVQTTLSVLSR